MMKRVKKILELAAQATVAVAVITSLSSCTLERPVGRSKVGIVVPDLTGMGANGILSKLDRADSKRASVTPSAAHLKNRRGAASTSIAS